MICELTLALMEGPVSRLAKVCGVVAEAERAPRFASAPLALVAPVPPDASGTAFMPPIAVPFVV